MHTTMSFLTRVVPAQSAVAGQAYRSFSTTLITQKGPIEAAKDVLKKADRAVSDAAVKGIETGGVLLIILCRNELFGKERN